MEEHKAKLAKCMLEFKAALERPITPYCCKCLAQCYPTFTSDELDITARQRMIHEQAIQLSSNSTAALLYQKCTLEVLFPGTQNMDDINLPPHLIETYQYLIGKYMVPYLKSLDKKHTKELFMNYQQARLQDCIKTQ